MTHFVGHVDATPAPTSPATSSTPKPLLRLIQDFYLGQARLADRDAKQKIDRVAAMNATLAHINAALADLGKVHAEVKDGDVNAVNTAMDAVKTPTADEARKIADANALAASAGKEAADAWANFNTTANHLATWEGRLADIENGNWPQSVPSINVVGEGGRRITRPMTHEEYRAYVEDLVSFFRNQLTVLERTVKETESRAEDAAKEAWKARMPYASLRERIHYSLANAEIPGDTVVFRSSNKLSRTEQRSDLNSAITKLQALATTRGNEIGAMTTQSTSAIGRQNAVYEGYKSFIDKWFQMLSQTLPGR